MDEKKKLIDFIKSNLDPEFMPEEDSLLEVLDSVSFLQLIVFIEEQFNVSLNLSAVSLEDFATIDGLAQMLSEQGEPA